MTNPRRKNGALRNKYRERFKAMGLNCSICGKPIDYSRPYNPSDPYCFVIDEYIPVSRWKEAGYSSARACAEDWTNVRPAHRLCNQIKSDKLPNDPRIKCGIQKYTRQQQRNLTSVPDGEW